MPPAGPSSRAVGSEGERRPPGHCDLLAEDGDVGCAGRAGVLGEREMDHATGDVADGQPSWSLLGAKTPVSDSVAGSTGSSTLV